MSTGIGLDPFSNIIHRPTQEGLEFFNNFNADQQKYGSREWESLLADPSDTRTRSLYDLRHGDHTAKANHDAVSFSVNMEALSADIANGATASRVATEHQADESQNLTAARIDDDQKAVLEKKAAVFHSALETARKNPRDFQRFKDERVPFVPMDALDDFYKSESMERIKRAPDMALDDDYREAAKMIALQEYYAKKGIFGKGVDIATQIPTFVAEFAATGGFYSGAKSIVGKAALKRGMSATSAKLVEGTLGRVAGVAAQASMQTGGLGRSVGGQLSANARLDAEGNFAAIDPKDFHDIEEFIKLSDNSFGEALAKGLVDHSIEVASERVGGSVLKPLMGKLASSAAGKAFGNLKPVKITTETFKGLQKRLLTDLAAKYGGFAKVLELSKKSGYDGLVEEWLEERVGDTARGFTDFGPEAIGLDQGFGLLGDVAQGNFQEATERGAAEAIGFALPLGAKHAASLSYAPVAARADAKDFYTNPAKAQEFVATSEQEKIDKLVAMKEPSRRQFSELGLPGFGTSKERKAFRDSVAALAESDSAAQPSTQGVIPDPTSELTPEPVEKKPELHPGFRKWAKEKSKGLKQPDTETTPVTPAVATTDPDIDLAPVVKKPIVATPKPVPGLPEDEKEPAAKPKPPELRIVPTLGHFQEEDAPALAKHSGDEPEAWVPFLDAIRRDARKAVFEDKRDFDAAVARGETPEHTLVSNKEHFAEKYVRDVLLKYRPDDAGKPLPAVVMKAAKQAHDWAVDALGKGEITAEEVGHDWLVPGVGLPGAVKPVEKNKGLKDKWPDKQDDRAPLVTTTDELNALSKHSIYQQDWKGKRKFLVRSDGPRGGGDGIFDTYDEAARYAETESKREQERSEQLKRQQESEEKEKQREAEYVASFKGFDADSPLKFGQSRKALEKKYNSRGKISTRKEMIERRIAEGWIVRDGKFQGPDGQFLEDKVLSATGLRYAQHLLSVGQTTPSASPAKNKGVKPKVVSDRGQTGLPGLEDAAAESESRDAERASVDETYRAVFDDEADEPTKYDRRDVIRAVRKQALAYAEKTLDLDGYEFSDVIDNLVLPGQAAELDKHQQGAIERDSLERAEKQLGPDRRKAALARLERLAYAENAGTGGLTEKDAGKWPEDGPKWQAKLDIEKLVKDVKESMGDDAWDQAAFDREFSRQAAAAHYEDWANEYDRREEAEIQAKEEEDKKQKSKGLKPKTEPEVEKPSTPAEKMSDEDLAAKFLEEFDKSAPPAEKSLADQFLEEFDKGQPKPRVKSKGKKRPAGERKPAKPKTPAVPKTAEQLRQEADAKLKLAHAAMREAAKKLNETTHSIGAVNPEAFPLVAKALRLYVEAGVLDFRAFVLDAKEAIGEADVRKFAKEWRFGWDTLRERRYPEMGESEDILAVLDEESANDTSGSSRDQTESERPEISRNAPAPGGATDADVLEGTPPQNVPGLTEGGGSDGVRDSAEGSVRQGISAPDNGGKDERRGRGADRRGASDDGVRGGGTGTDLAPEVSRPNYHLTDPDKIVGGSPKVRFERNRKAIQIVKAIQEDNRPPTAEELDTLAGYTGWGAFGQELFQGNWDNPSPKKGWEEEDEWLRAFVGEDEWKSAQQSIINAHYTSPEVVTGMWDMLRQMGFDGGRVLEPSLGTGNFFSLMPRDLMARSTLTGIELDKLTADMASVLHPQANIRNYGYQDSQTPDNFYDLIVSNVPFANVPVPDRKYKTDFSVHNYFFRKSLDQVKPGGLVAFITSNSTMDGKTQAKLLRAQIDKEADLVKAFRFPSGAFQKYAGTNVVADLIIFRKRKEGETPVATEWGEIVPYSTPAGQEIEVNEYWAKNPGSILGTMNYGHGTTSGRPGMIVDQPQDLMKTWQQAIASVPRDIFNTVRAKSQGKERANKSNRRQDTVVSEAGDLYIAKGEQLLPLIDFVKWYRKGSKKSTIAKNRQEIEAAIQVRDVLSEVLDRQSASQDAGQQRKKLSDVYDAFVAKYGPLSESNAVDHIRKAGDPLGSALVALESKESDGTYSKRPIFTRSTVRTKRSIENPSLHDAFAMARNESFTLNMDRVAQLAKLPVEEATTKLEAEGLLYKIGDNLYEAADLFLSGNLAKKIRSLEAAAQEGVTGLERSIADAKAKLPEPVAYSQIEANLGVPWVESRDYQDFLGSLLNEPADSLLVERRTNGWKVTIPSNINAKAEAVTVHGHPSTPFSKIASAAMNNGSIKVMMPDPEDPTGNNKVVDTVATQEVTAKISELRDKFKEWIWGSQERIGRLAGVYNEEFNSSVTPEFFDVPLDFEGLALERGDDPFSLRKHQEAAVWRGIISGKGIYGHEVGTGKTLTMGALAMESRRLGLANKPVLLAHNANSRSVTNEIQQAYPGAKILYIDNLDPSRRQETLSSIATEDWDLIVVPHSLTDRFQMRPETLERLLKDELDALGAAAIEAYEEDEGNFKGTMPKNLDNISEDDLKKLKSPTAKDLVKERMKLRARIVEAHQAASKAKTIFFEDMGIDMVMVDEAHVYKKLPISTKQRIKGLNTAGSQRGTMLMLLSDYVRQSNNGRGVYVFTGTPLTNTLNEIYNMMRFVMPDEMDAVGVKSWDTWFNTFANAESNLELSSGGTWETFDRLSSFINLPELRQMAGRYMDIVFADDMPEFKDRDSRDGRTENPVGRPFKQIHNETLEMLPEVKAYSQDLADRYTEFKNATGKQKKEMMHAIGGKNNPVVIEGEGVKLALDPRLAGIGVLPDNMSQMTDDFDPKNPQLKVNRMIRTAMIHYNEHPKSTQMIFMQTGHSDWVERVVGRTPDGEKIKQKFRVFNLAKEIKRRLIEEGVPAEQIVLFSAITDKAKRAETAQKMQRGEIRFAIGSTETMGTGVNAQNEMVAMHHLDAPWMPGDLEQRNGRGHRQGNRWNTVHEYRYLTEGPQDGRRWQVLLTKFRFIFRFLRSNGNERTIDMDDVDLSDDGEGGDMEATFASAAGDPRIMQRAKLQKDVDKLEAGRHRYAKTIQATANTARHKAAGVATLRERIALAKADYEKFKSTRPEGDSPPTITIRGKEYTGKERIDGILHDMEVSQFYGNKYTTIGEYRGLPLFWDIDSSGKKEMFLGEAKQPVRFSLQSLNSIATNIPDRIAKREQEIEKDLGFIKMSEESFNLPFPKLAQLEARKAKLAALEAELSASPTPSPAWFRNATPVGSSVYFEGKEYGVAGHRGETHVLTDVDDLMVSLPAGKVTDEQGTPLYPELAQAAKAIDDIRERIGADFTLVEPGKGYLGNPTDASKEWRIVSPSGLVVGMGATPEQAVMNTANSNIAGFLSGLRDELSAAEKARKAAVEKEKEAGEGGAIGSAFGFAGLGNRIRPPLVAGAIQHPNDDVERRLTNAHGAKKPSLWEKLGAGIATFAKQSTRAQEHLPNNERWSVMNEMFRLFKQIPENANFEADRMVATIVSELQGDTLHLFNRKLIVENQIAALDRGEPLRFGFTDKADVEAYRDQLDAAIAENPVVKEALERRTEIIREHVENLVRNDVLPSSALENTDTYYHQQVSLYAEADRQASGKRTTHRKKYAFQKARVKGEVLDEKYDYNTSYLEAEKQWLRDSFAALAQEKWLVDLERREGGMKKTLKQQAKQQNFENLVGGPDVVAEINRLKQLIRDNRGNGEITEPAIERMLEIDPTYPFRIRIAKMAAGMKPHLDLNETLTDPEAIRKDRWIKIHQLAKADEDADGKLFALGFLKAISERNRMIRRELGSRFLTWNSERNIPEGYSLWQPTPGNVFFRAYTIPERIAEQLLEGITAEMGITKEQVRTALAMGGPKTQFVLPNELIAQMETMEKPRGDQHVIGRLSEEAMSNWKVWTLLNPFKAGAYNLRNAFGDAEAVLASAPGALKHVRHSFRDLAVYYHDPLNMSEDLEKARELGVISSSLTEMEIPDIKESSTFARFYEKEGGLTTPIHGYFDWVKKYTTFRENILRYSAYRYFLSELENGTLVRYGGAKKAVVDALAADMGKEVAAAHLARNLLGDYGNLTVTGNFIRRHAMPFYSFVEVNGKRWPRFAINAAVYAKEKGKDNPTAVAAWGAMATLQLGAMYAALWAFNNLVHPDAEDDLNKDERASPHLIIKRLPDGSVVLLRNISTLGDFLEWFGINTTISHFDQWQQGKVGTGEMATNAAMSPVNKAILGLRPDAKMLMEFPAGVSTYPDPFNPRKTDRDELLAGTVGAVDLWRSVKGRVTGSGERARPNSLVRAMVGVSDPRQNALGEMYDLRDRFQKKAGGDIPSRGDQNFKNMREAAKAEDMESFAKARDRFLKSGKSYKQFKASLANLDPIAKMNAEDEIKFEQEYLSGEQRQKLRVARDHAHDLGIRMWHWWNNASVKDDPAVRKELNVAITAEVANKIETLARIRPYQKDKATKLDAEIAAAKKWLKDRDINPDKAMKAYFALHKDAANKDRLNDNIARARIRLGLAVGE